MNLIELHATKWIMLDHEVKFYWLPESNVRAKKFVRQQINMELLFYDSTTYVFMRMCNIKHEPCAVEPWGCASLYGSLIGMIAEQ